MKIEWGVSNFYWNYIAEYMKPASEIPCYTDEHDKHTDMTKLINQFAEKIEKATKRA